MTRAVRALVILAALAAAAPASAAVPRAQGLDPIEPIVLGDEDLLVDDLVVAAGPQWLYGWSVRGGPAERLARLPELGPFVPDGIFSDGAVRVAAAESGRVVVVRESAEGAAPVAFDRGRGPQLVVGPPRGPFEPVGGCGEVSGIPAALDGSVLAYRTAPVPGRCADPVVTGPAIVVRDLAADAVRRVLPLPRARRSVDRLEVAGDFLAYATPADDLDGRNAVIVVDLRTGDPVTVLPRRPWEWTLAPDGTLLARAAPPGWRPACPRRPLLRFAPAPGGVPVPGAHPCRLGLLDVVDGAVRFATGRADGRFAFRAVDPVTGAGRTLAVTSGIVFDGDARHLLADDEDCGPRHDTRIIAIGDRPAGPAGPRRCRVSVHVQRRARADGAVRVRLRCPDACRVSVRDATRRDPDEVDPRVPARDVTVRGRRTLRLPVSPRAARRGRMRVVVRPQHPVVRERIVRTVTVF